MNKFKFLYDNFTKYGYKIFPICENSKEPLIDRWQTDASNHSGQIVYWLENAKNCNFALPAYANNLFIIDIDMHGDVDGVGSFKKLIDDLGIDKSELDTLKQVTPSGGIHLIFKSDAELDCVKNSSNTFDGYPGIDIRTKGYILIQPSVINGVPYKLNGGVDKIISMPDKLKEFILKCNEKIREYDSKRDESSYYYEGKVVDKGSRDDEIFSYIRYLYHSTKLGYLEILALAKAYNKDCFNPPLSEKDIEYKVKKTFEKERRNYILVRF